MAVLLRILSIVLYIGVGVIFFGLIIFVHELGHYIAARLAKVKIKEFSLGMGPCIFKKISPKTGIQYSLRAIPMGGFLAMEGEDEESADENALSKKPAWKRAGIMVAGAFMNLLLGLIIAIIMVSTSGNIATRTISRFEDNAVSSEKLMVDDTIVSANGIRIFTATDIFYQLQRVKGDTVDMVVLRDGEKIELKDVPFAVREEDGQRYLARDFRVYVQQRTFTSCIKQSFLWTASMARMVWLNVVDLITGNMAINQLSGPVGIVSVIGDVVASSKGIDFEYLLIILGMITINVGIFNLLPLPALDGGRVLFILVEVIFRKPIPAKYEAIIHVAGFLLLILLMLYATYNDITRLFIP